MTFRWRGIGLGLALVLVSWLAWAAKAPPLALDDAPSQRFADHLAVFHDPSGAGDLATIRRADAAGLFKPQPDSGFSFGFLPGNVWIRIVLFNPMSVEQQRWLVLENPFIASSVLHWLDEAGGETVQANGAVIPVEQRPLPAAKALFPVTIPAGRTLVGYLRIGGPTLLMSPMALWQPVAYLESENQRLMIKTAVIAAAVTVVALFSLLAWRRSGRLAMFGAGLGDAFFGLAALMFDGVAARWLPAGEALWQNRLLGILLLSGLFCHLIFCRSFLDLPKTSPRLAKGMAGLAILCLLLATMQVFSLNLKWLTLTAVPLLVAAMGLMVAVAAWRGIKNARQYILAWGVLFLTIVVRALTGLFAAPSSIQDNDLFVLGFLVGTLVLSYAMYRDMENVGQEAERARQRLLEFQRTEQTRLVAVVEARTREMREAKRLAETAGQVRLAFLSTVSHELRTPLHTIVGYAQLLRKGGRREADAKLSVIETSGLQLLYLIDQILVFVRGGNQLVAPRLEPVSLAQLAGQVADTGTMLAAPAGNRFEVCLADALPALVAADEHKLTQVLTNLIGNACKYTANGTVTLRIEPEFAAGDGVLPEGVCRVRFTIEDTGAGVDAEHREMIFEPFKRAPGSEHQPGVGLGLTIARQTVRAMGGDISLDSQPGHGSRFFFSLLLRAVPDDEFLPLAVESPRIVGHAGPQRSLLVVDDITENRTFLEDLCSAWGFRVLTASDGAEALRLCRSADPALSCVLVDQFMPVLDGWGFLRELRASAELAHLPVILISAAEPERPDGFPVGVDFDHVLLKPIRHQELAEYLRQRLDLEWQLEDPASAAVDRGGPREADAVLPRGGDLAAFAEMLAMGKIVAIRRWAEQLMLAQPELGAFATEVVGLVERVDLVGLKALLSRAEQAAKAN